MPQRRPSNRDPQGGGRPRSNENRGDENRGGYRGTGRPAGGRPTGGRPSGGRPSGGRPSGGRPAGGRPSEGRGYSRGPDRGPDDRRPGTRRRPSERPMGGSRRPDFRRTGPRGPRPEAEGEVPTGERLQKILASAGIASRRDCEELIAQGRVEVDGKVISELGVRVDPARAEIKVDGATLPKVKLVYYALNKPAGVLCTNDDPDGRERVIDLIPSKERLFTIGRLDQYSEGLIIVTNDGALANKLAHPRYEVPKEYLVEVAGHLNPEDIRKLLKGVHLAEGVAKVDKLFIRHRRPGCMVLEMVLREGKNREIRRVLARIGHKVMKLKRVAYGPLRLAKMPAGAHRRLTVGEVRELENYDPRHDKRYARRPKADKASEKPDLEELDTLLPETAEEKSAAASPRKRARREAADLHGHLEGAPRGRVLRRPNKPVKGAVRKESTSESRSETRAEIRSEVRGDFSSDTRKGTVLGGEAKIKLKPGSEKFVRPWQKPVVDDDDDGLDEV